MLISITVTFLFTDPLFEIITGNSIPVQAVPIPNFVQKIPGRVSAADQELVFLATALPPLGIKSYYVRKVTKNRRMFKSKYVSHQPGILGDDEVIANEV